MAGKALDDLILVEFAQMVSGPMCGKMFADIGAEVIKIEPPRRKVKIQRKFSKESGKREPSDAVACKQLKLARHS